MDDLLDRFDLSDEGDLELVLSIKDTIKHNPKACVTLLERAIERAAEKLDLCPACLSKLQERTDYEPYEVWGTVVRQRVAEAFCPVCG